MSEHIVLGVTGSIAAYKAADIVRLLRKSSREVTVLMTDAATRFIGTETMQALSGRVVMTDVFGTLVDGRPPHIGVAEQADLVLIAPCSANVLAKLACGLADDLLSCLALAVDSPIAVAPAMNDRMWRHPATVSNVATLRKRGVEIIDVSEGDLACGYTGKGRMAEPEEVVARVDALLAKGKGSAK